MNELSHPEPLNSFYIVSGYPGVHFFLYDEYLMPTRGMNSGWMPAGNPMREMDQ